jgi:hypothetical protein
MITTPVSGNAGQAPVRLHVHLGALRRVTARRETESALPSGTQTCHSGFPTP